MISSGAARARIEIARTRVPSVKGEVGEAAGAADASPVACDLHHAQASGWPLIPTLCGWHNAVVALSCTIRRGGDAPVLVERQVPKIKWWLMCQTAGQETVKAVHAVSDLASDPLLLSPTWTRN